MNLSCAVREINSRCTRQATTWRLKTEIILQAEATDIFPSNQISHFQTVFHYWSHIIVTRGSMKPTRKSHRQNSHSNLYRRSHHAVARSLKSTEGRDWRSCIFRSVKVVCGLGHSRLESSVKATGLLSDFLLTFYLI